jgi:haloalkane dehalogenase
MTQGLVSQEAVDPEVMRTPDDCFVDLPDYPFQPHYCEVGGESGPKLRMHYLDEGPADGQIVLLMHGQPTWSYLYRFVIPVLVEAGLRVIAPDNIGFGRSDKLAERTAYTFARHIGWTRQLIEALDLTHITLVAQDWGGPIGLGCLAKDPDRFAGVVVSNTVLHTADPALAGKVDWANYGVDDGRVVLQEGLVDYLLYYYRAPEIVPSLFLNAVAGPLPDAVRAAYDAPFPTEAHKAGVRQLTGLIPLTRNDVGAAINRSTMDVLATFDRPFLTAYSDGDPATAGWDRVFQEHVPGAMGQPHCVISGAGHYVQEQKGDELGQIVARFAATAKAESD